jgi:hypothetical protein
LLDETKKPESSEEIHPRDERQEPGNATPAETWQEVGESAATRTQSGLQPESDQRSNVLVEPLPNVSGTGEPYQTVAYGQKLRGRTNAGFSSSFQTIDVEVTAGRGCKGCQRQDCVQVVGTLESTFTVATTVTLPSVADFPDLTPCQQQRVRDAINNVLAPHEQQHVAAFSRYNGTVQTPFDLTLCRGAFNARIKAMHHALASARQAAAQAASDALDPFNFEGDLNCEDSPGAGTRRTSADTPDASAKSHG